ncbi:pantoate--beta-alanine ligase [Capnocytophaga sp. oral taxon 878]|uniref:pantoate--beta-alanine ligase n=1 Tax=Capnocytophaga sp. oral taxon 878 TaxID=1316596 RepID=UPI000D03B87E|nr:pantoate--beta-alanine ligase [Capnocytophaga sp. oral taxon 878]AVM50263.1 pantoate--beta-alanine ligase [Capnocytophaga sp. oral taxon 878]
MIYTEQNVLHNTLQSLKNQGKTIGLVPTMGALHNGHLSLVKKAKEENDITVVSIFVNPTQFNNPTDLERYPRTLEADAALLATVAPDLLIFAPTVADIYGSDVSSESFDFGQLDKEMEGSSRPGHFDGVGTIVNKLFEIVLPDRAYFGEKDYQQLLIIKKMVEQKGLPVTIVPCAIVRNEEGLALSSRNALLSEEMKKRATFIYRTLMAAKERFATHTPTEVEAWVKEVFAKESDFSLEYFTITDADTLQHITKKEGGKNYRAFIVVHAEGVRLIDNMSM